MDRATLIARIAFGVVSALILMFVLALSLAISAAIEAALPSVPYWASQILGAVFGGLFPAIIGLAAAWYRIFTEED